VAAGLQVMAVALNADGTRAVTASKDGTLRTWNLAVRYHMRVRGRARVLTPGPEAARPLGAWVPGRSAWWGGSARVPFLAGTCFMTLPSLRLLLFPAATTRSSLLPPETRHHPPPFPHPPRHAAPPPAAPRPPPAAAAP